MRASRWAMFPLLVPLAVWAAAPPPPRPADDAAVAKLIAQLGDEDLAVRQAAMKKLEAAGDRALPALRKAVKSHPDVDVRLRAAVVARAIAEKGWAAVRVFGGGADLKVAPPGGGYWFNRVAFTKDGKYAVVGGGGLILYDLKTGKEVRRVLEVGGARPGLAMSKDGRYCLTGHANSADVHLVEVPSFKTVRTFRGATGALGVALSPDGQRAAVTWRDGSLRLWDVKTGKALARVTSKTSGPQCVAFSPGGDRLLTGHAGGAGAAVVRMRDAGTGKFVRTFTGHAGAVTAVAFLPGGKKGLSTGTDGTARVWDLESGKELLRMEHKGGVNDAAVSPDGKRALTAGFEDKAVRLWDLATGEQLHAFEGHLWRVLGVAFSADGTHTLSSDGVAAVRLWKLKD